MKCLHCRGFARARSSELLTPTYREVRFECVDDACGFVWVAGIEALRTLCPSDRPNPAIDIPMFSARYAVTNDPATSPVAG